MSPALAAEASAPARVTIQVADPSGADVPHAHVRIVPTPDKPPALMETDGQGRLSFDLKPGGYALFVTAPGFKGHVAHMEVAASEAVQSVPVRLQIGSASSPAVISTADAKDTLTLAAYPYHNEVMLKAAELKSLPHVTVTIHNPHRGADETYAGVPVAQLFGKLGAPLGKELRGDALTCFLVASGSDGYQAVLSLAEVDPSFHPGDVLVADAMNGSPLDAKSGPFKLVVTEDKRPARSVHNLVRLELKSTAY